MTRSVFTYDLALSLDVQIHSPFPSLTTKQCQPLCEPRMFYWISTPSGKVVTDNNLVIFCSSFPGLYFFFYLFPETLHFCLPLPRISSVTFLQSAILLRIQLSAQFLLSPKVISSPPCLIVSVLSDFSLASPSAFL